MGGKWEPDIRAGAVWRLLTAIFLHAGILHIASNLFFQLRFGYITELRWGRWRWLAVYIISGVMASLFSTKLGPRSVSVGASGALFGQCLGAKEAAANGRPFAIDLCERAPTDVDACRAFTFNCSHVRAPLIRHHRC